MDHLSPNPNPNRSPTLTLTLTPAQATEEMFEQPVTVEVEEAVEPEP